MRSSSQPLWAVVLGLVVGITCVVLGVLMVVDERSTQAWLTLALFTAFLVVHVLRVRRALRLRRPATGP